MALGTAKACLTDNRTKREKGKVPSCFHNWYSTVEYCHHPFAVTIAELQENTEALKTKMSELRLYCDLLLQQVNKIKENDELGDTAEVRLMYG